MSEVIPFLVSESCVNIFILVGVFFQLNFLIGAGNTHHLLLYLLLLLPMQAFSLTNTLATPDTFISNLIICTMMNLWMIASHFKVIRKDFWLGYKKLVQTIREDLKSGNRRDSLWF
ncbi:MAG: hypothetical protein ACLFTB_01490 [Desulfovibrionales bacterium]